MTSWPVSPDAPGAWGDPRPTLPLPRIPGAWADPPPTLPLPRQPQGGAVEAVWQRNRDVLGSAGSLVAATGVASVLGFAYWAFAARTFSQESVGYGSAAVSAMTLLGTVGMLGLGTVLIGELPRRSPRIGLIAAALLTCGLASLLLGLGFAVVAPHVSTRFTGITGTPQHALLFTAGVVLTGAALVFDQATIGLQRGGLQLWRNAVFATAKLAALPVTALVLHDRFGVDVTLSWVAGLAVSVAPVALRLRLTGTQLLPRPDWGVLRGLGKAAVSHHWLNLAIQAPRLLIPVLVTVIVSPSANAAFYAAWTLSGFLYIVPTHLATALFAVASADAKAIARKLRLTLRLSAVIGVPGMAVLALGAHLALAVFGARYAAAAAGTLSLLAIGYLPVVPKVHYIAVCRATGKVQRAAVVLTLAGALELAAATMGGYHGGLRGLSLALLAAFTVEGVVTAPPVLRAAIGRGRHAQSRRRSRPPASPGPQAVTGGRSRRGHGTPAN